MANPPHNFIQADSAGGSPLAPGSVSMIATSPPYFGLRAYEGDRPLTWPDGWIGGLGQEPTLDLYLEHIAQYAGSHNLADVD